MSGTTHGVRALEPLCALLRSGRCDLTTEAATQRDLQSLIEGVGGVLSIAGVTGWHREYRLTPEDRPDFVVFVPGGLIPIEAKHRRARPAQVLRQLERYAAHPDVVALVLATGVAMAVPESLNGKPLAYVGLGGAWL